SRPATGRAGGAEPGQQRHQANRQGGEPRQENREGDGEDVQELPAEATMIVAIEGSWPPRARVVRTFSNPVILLPMTRKGRPRTPKTGSRRRYWGTPRAR